MRFGRELRKWRKRRKLTQRVLAIKAGVNRVTVAHLERGATKPSLDLTWRLAQALDVKMADLLAGWGEERRNGKGGGV